MLTAIRDINRQARAAGYSPEDVREAEFATVAFLDEVVLSLPDSTGGFGRAEWKRQTLAVELYGEARAGEVFFDKLDSLLTGRRDSPHVADVLEVYLLCLLLGFEGRYADMRGELASTAERLRRKIDGVRNADYRLAPSATPEPLVPAAIPAIQAKHWMETWAVPLMVGVAVLVFLFLKLDLSWATNRLVNAIRG
jgi:type VI secretion system protein ImpK